MKVLVYPHAMEIGGSQFNAVQLAGAMRARGHQVLVVSEPGPLVEHVRGHGIEHVEIPRERRRPSPEVIATLAKLVRRQRIDVVHGYEWPPVVEALFGPGLVSDTPVVGTVMSMSVVPFFPKTVPLVVGTERIREAAVAAGHRRVTLLEPWVDTDADTPAISGAGFRAAYGIQREDLVCAMVCRLVPELKLEGILAACDAVGRLAAAGRRIRLLIVGDGRARAEIAERAAKANAAAGWDAIILTGELADPRPAYAAADILIGQGGSALRGMAFERPLVVVGEDGFSELLTPRSLPLFLEQGWYGLGAGSLGSGAPALAAALEQLADSPRMRTELGAFARRLVVDRFSLTRAAEVQEREYFAAMSERAGEFALFGDLARSGAGVVNSALRRKFRRRFGRGVATDDANARPLAGTVPGRGSSEER